MPNDYPPVSEWDNENVRTARVKGQTGGRDTGEPLGKNWSRDLWWESPENARVERARGVAESGVTKDIQLPKDPVKRPQKRKPSGARMLGDSRKSSR